MPDHKYHAIIADDHAIVRAGLRQSLENPGLIEPGGISVLAEAANGLEAIALCRQHRPDLLLLDVQMPLAGGQEVLVEVRRWSPRTRVIILTGSAAAGKIAQLVQSGVDGLFPKADDTAELFEAIPRILRGGRHIAKAFETALSEFAPPILTQREHQILNLVVAGRTNRDIGTLLGISAKTVDRHRTNLMQKLGCHSAAELMAYALDNDLLDRS